ncbi:RING finger protein nhl-1 [Cephus cinctus]|uniref:RING finger protein nhl-1 n=1 Tax=Cephus cinctus TaxID=211228 RepID=A0AAJ7RFC2_CEPCN|nr:RING finger protein nhl-1 [Cephus cinctus]XP_024939435.1 RING finger protein nhl-1 [Cephus cinctus]
MTSKFKSMFKRQASQSVHSHVENTEESSAIMQEMYAVSSEFMVKPSISRDNQEAESSITIRAKSPRRRYRTSLGAIEDLLQCLLCMERLKSPRMMPCQHTFCENCLAEQIMDPGNLDKVMQCPLCHLTVVDSTPEKLPTNLYIESLLRVMENPGDSLTHFDSRSPIVSFAPTTNQSQTENRAEKLIRCKKCGTECTRDNKCNHCKQIFCGVCWVAHMDELKELLGSIAEQLEATANRFEYRIDEFRAKIDALKESIDKDIELRIAELKHEREERIKKATATASKGEFSAEEIKQRIFKIQAEVNEQKDATYATLADNHEKVKTFLLLHHKASDVMAAIAAWKPDLSDDVDYDENKQRLEVTKSKENVNLYYKSKAFTPKLIVGGEVVHRPSGLAFDPWRQVTFVACPGTSHIVALDKKFKVLRRIQHKDMLAPQGILFLEDMEELFVTDKWKHCIYVFNKKGDFIRRIGSKGIGDTQFRSPEGIAAHPRQNLIYVADTGNDRVQILQPDGTFYGSIGLIEKQVTNVTLHGKVVNTTANHFNQPTDVAVSLSTIVVADCGNHKIKVFSHDLQHINTIGGPGSIRGLFRSPEIVKVDIKGNIIVGDSGNGRIQIFSPEGDLLRILGSRGTKTGQFGWVSGLLIKDNLEIIVSDSKNYTIQVF